MTLFKDINFRQPKYTLPLILYLPILGCAYFLFRFGDIEVADVGNSKLETTDHINSKLPAPNIKGDGIGDKYSNMLNDFGKIKDESAVENINRMEEDQKEEYTSQYNDAEIAAMDRNSPESQVAEEKLSQLQEQIRRQQEKDNNFLADRTTGNTAEEQATLDALSKTLEEARLMGENHIPSDMSDTKTEDTDDNNDNKNGKKNGKMTNKEKLTAEATITINENAVTELADEAKPEEVVKKQKETSEYFNTIATNEPEHKLIRAIVDEDIKATDGSRVRLRLLDDIDIGERTIQSGTWLYCTMSGFSQQRVKGNVRSILINDELVKVNLTLYDTDGLEGLYVPKSNFRETTKDIASGAMSNTSSLTQSTSSTTDAFSQWGTQALTNAVQKTSNAISKAIKKNTVKVKYGTQVYLINSKDNRK